MQNGKAERELLLGVLALQNNFVTQEQLLTAFREWTADKSAAFAGILEKHGALKKKVRPVLESLVDAHIESHDNDAEQSLASVNSLSHELSQELQQLDDPDLQESLCGLPDNGQKSDPNIALTLTMGGASAECGRFRILRPHRRGGLGEVFVARDEELDREVALKQILKRRVNDDEQRFRFVREAEITGKLEHPGIIPVYGLGQDDKGRPYYAMRFIRGKTLREALREFHAADEAPSRDPVERNKDFRRLLGWFIDVCDAIGYAHSRGVLHRDIKPSNIMLGRYGETLVVDWGLARVAGVDEKFSGSTDEVPVLANLSGGSSETIDGTAVGTPAFMSPEQAAGRLDLLTPATDVYGLGATLFSIITGKPALDGKAVDVLPRVISGSIPAAREVNPGVPQALEFVCKKAMSLDRLDRYQTPHELSAEVEAWLADEPVTACPEPARDRMRRWARRNHTAVTTVIAAVLVLATSASIAAGLLGRKNQELESANVSIRDKNIELQESNHATEVARQRADSVKDYLVAAFRSADPSLDGRKLTVVEVLDRSLREMDDRLDSDDLTRADLLAAIGTSYRGLGLYREMLTVFQREKKLRDRLEGEDSQAALQASSNVALAVYYSGDYVQAAELFRSVADRQKMTLGADHADVLTSMNGIALAYSAEGKHPDALKLHQDIVEKRRTTNGDDALETLLAINNLATAHQSSGQLKEAHEIFRDNLERYRELHGEDHLQTILATARLASISNALGHTKEAISLYEQALAKRRSKLGDQHPATIESISGLAFAYRDSARLEEARELLEEALEARKKNHGEDHPLTMSSMNDLARVYMSLGQYDDAAELAKTGADKCEAALGDSNPKTLAALNTLAMIYFRQGKPESAVPVFEKLLELYVRDYTDEHPTTNTVRNNLAMTYRNVGKLRESVPLFEQTLEWRTRELGDDHPKTLISMQNMASILNSLGQLQEALETAEPALEKHRAKLSGSHRYTLSAIDILSRIYIGLGDTRKAAPLADEGLKNAKTALEDDHPDVLKAMDLVATVHLRAGERAAAKQLLQETIDLRTKALGKEHPMTLSSMIRLAECHLLSEALDEGVALARESHEMALTKPGEGHPLTLTAARVFGQAQSMRDQHDSAIELLTATAEIQTERLGKDHPSTLKTQHALGDALFRKKQYDTAKIILEEVLSDRKSKLPADHVDTWQTRLVLAKCLIEKKEYTRAGEVLKPVEEFFDSLPQPALPVENELLVTSAEVLARLYDGLGESEKAEAWRKRSQK